ncbi:hypothetical protein [Crocosphaera sp. Alani8]|uniref:hypothetical protein n=1 Tax=Crocosphaera sp. Alani8 TaxID=3038952 RepID=UPI00313C9C8B
MNMTQLVRCPNCGNYAQRHYFRSEEIMGEVCGNRQVIQTECSSCDYLMVIFSDNGQVIETSSLGMATTIHSKNRQNLTPQVEKAILA